MHKYTDIDKKFAHCTDVNKMQILNTNKSAKNQCEESGDIDRCEELSVPSTLKFTIC